MKKILPILLLLISCVSFGQTFLPPRSSASTTVQDSRLRGLLNFYLPHIRGFNPGNAFGLNGGLDTLGAIVYDDSSQHVFYRDTIKLGGGHQWQMILKIGDVVSGVSSFNTRTGAVVLNSTDISNALGGAPLLNVTNYIQAGTSVTITGLGTLSSPYIINSTASGTGTVTQFNFTNGNGVTGSVLNATTTPTLSLGTSLTGIINGNGTGFGTVSIGSGLNYSGGVLSATGGTSLNGLVSANGSAFTTATIGAGLSFSGNTLTNTINNTNQLTNGAGFLTNITGLVTPGTGVTITGSGTSVSPYVINSSGSGITGAGNLSPLFTTSIVSNTLTFTLSNATANSVFGNNTGSAAPPLYYVPTLTTLNGWASGSIALLGATQTFTSTNTFNGTVTLGASVLFSADNSYSIGAIGDAAASVWTRSVLSNSSLLLGSAASSAITFDIGGITNMQLLSTGQLNLSKYNTSTSFTGTPTSIAEFDASGNIIQGGLTGFVNSVTNSDGTLTISPTAGNVVASLSLGHANTWSALQTFGTLTTTGTTEFTGVTSGASSDSLLTINPSTGKVTWRWGQPYNIYPVQLLSMIGTHSDSLALGGINGTAFQNDSLYFNNFNWYWYNSASESSIGTGDSMVIKTSSEQIKTAPILSLGTQLTAGQRVMTDPTTGYLNTQAEVLHQPVKYAVEVPLPAYTVSGNVITATVNNALVINGVTPSVNDRLLLFLEPNAVNNGIWVVTQVGSGSLPFILTRGGYSSVASNMAALSMVAVTNGYYAGKLFRQTTPGTITIGTTKLEYSTVETFNVAHFGAVGDGKEVYDGATTASSHNLTSATANFTSADVGKGIRVPRANGTSDYIGTISSVTNSTTVVLSGTAPSATTSSDTVRYGTDNTVAFQNDINAVSLTQYGGVIKVPSGWYMFFGTLQTNVASANPNCQLYFPAAGLLVAGQNTRRTYVIEGEQAAHQTPGIFPDSVVPKRGAILESMIDGTVTSSVPPAVFGTRSATGFSGFNYSKIVFHNITLFVQPNQVGGGPTMSGINGFYSASMHVNDCVIAADCNVGGTGLVTNESAGLILNSQASEVDVNADNDYVSGFKYAYIGADHAEFANITAMANNFDFVPTKNYDGIHVNNGHFLWATALIYIPNSTIMSGMITKGPTYYKVDNLDAEEYISSGSWFDTKYTISDSGSNGHSMGFYTLAQSTIGLNSLTMSKFNKYDPGADSNYFYPIGSPLASTPSAPGNNGDVLLNTSGSIGVISSDNFYFDQTNIRLGIGAGSSPANKLEIDQSTTSLITGRIWNSNASGASEWLANGSSAGTGIFQYNTSHAAYGAIPAGGGAWYTSAPTGVLMVDNASGALRIAVGSGSGPSEQARFTSTGDLLIGTTTDNARLHLGGSTSTNPSNGLGIDLNIDRGTTNTDGTGGTSALFSTAYIGDNTFAASSATTYTIGATLTVNNAPSAGTNVTITNPYALYIAAGNSYFNGNVTTASNASMTSSHFIGNSSAPSIAGGTGAGTGPTISITGTDQSGIITVTPGTTPSASATVATITYSVAYPNHTYPVLTPANSAAALLTGVTMVYTTGSTTNFTITSGTTGLTATTTYSWYYHVGGQ